MQRSSSLEVLVSRSAFLCTISPLEGTSGAEEKLTSTLEGHTNKDPK